MRKSARKNRTNFSELGAAQARIYADWLRGCWPADTVKQAARALGVAPATVQALIYKQRPPSGDLIRRGVALWGQGFRDAIFAPCGPEGAEPGIEARFEMLRRQLDALWADYRRLDAGRGDRVGQAGDRAAADAGAFGPGRALLGSG